MKNTLAASFLLCAILTLPEAQSPLRPQWTLMNGVDGGEILSVASGEGVLFASTRKHGVFRSPDSGKSWRPIIEITPTLKKLDFDSTTGNFYGLSDSALYLAASSEGPWIPLMNIPKNEPFFSTNTSDFSVHGATIILLIGQSEGVMVSRDGGKNWKTSVYPTVGINIISILAADTCVYVGTMDAEVSASCNGGTTWRPVGGGQNLAYAYGLARYRGAIMAATGYGLYRSLDQGRTWSSWGHALQGEVTPGESKVWALKNKGSHAIYASKSNWNDQNVFTEKFYRTADGGQTWTELGPFPEASASSTGHLDGGVEVAELGTRLYAASFRGLLESGDSGNTWARVRFGLGESSILSLACLGKNFLALTQEGVYTSLDSGASWKVFLRNDSGTTWTALAGSSTLFAALNNHGVVQITLDSGVTWRSLSHSDSRSTQSLAVLGRFLYLGGSSLWRVDVAADDWKEFPWPSPDAPRLMKAGNQSILLCGNRHLWEFREADGFQDLTGNISPSLVQGIWMVGEKPFVSSNGILSAWDNAHSVWRQVQSVNGFAFSLTGYGQHFVFASSTGTHFSSDGGQIWRPIYLNAAEFRFLTIEGRQVYGGDSKGGVWKLNPALPDSPVSLKAAGNKTVRIHRSLGTLQRIQSKEIRLDGRSF